MDKNKNLTVRTVYLYVATLIGLSLIIAGGVQGFELLLKSTVLQQADAEQRLWARQPPMPYMSATAESLLESPSLTEEEMDSVRSWLRDYQAWEEQRAAFDAVAADRQRQAATALGLLFGGIPVYLYHWLTIRKENRRTATGGDSSD